MYIYICVCIYTYIYIYLYMSSPHYIRFYCKSQKDIPQSVKPWRNCAEHIIELSGPRTWFPAKLPILFARATGPGLEPRLSGRRCKSWEHPAEKAEANMLDIVEFHWCFCTFLYIFCVFWFSLLLQFTWKRDGMYDNWKIPDLDWPPGSMMFDVPSAQPGFDHRIIPKNDSDSVENLSVYCQF